MTYVEACSATISRDDARHEIRDVHEHDQETWEAFLADYGDKVSYEGWEVLDFLGY